MTVFRVASIFCVTFVMATPAFATTPVRVGSKAFTESVILGELATQLGNNAGVPTIHRSQLGGTRVLWQALLAGQIDVYPEYSGTIAEELVPGPGDLESLRTALGKVGINLGSSLGFEDNYAVGMRREAAAQHSI